MTIMLTIYLEADHPNLTSTNVGLVLGGRSDRFFWEEGIQGKRVGGPGESHTLHSLESVLLFSTKCWQQDCNEILRRTNQVTAILLSLEKEFEQCQRGLEEFGCPDQVNDLKLLREAPRKKRQKTQSLGNLSQINAFFSGGFPNICCAPRWNQVFKYIDKNE